MPTADVMIGDRTHRPRPAERVAGACAVLPPKDAARTGQDVAAGTNGCATSLDCPGETARCSLHTGFGRSSCECSASECVVDADCGEGKACECGSPGVPCGRTTACEHHCVIADCRTSADCPEGAVCSPSVDMCGLRPESYHCHDATKDACLSDWECPGYDSCRWLEGAWGCDSPAMCD